MIVYSDQDEEYRSVAQFQLRQVRTYSADACAILEELRPYGWKAIYDAAFTVMMYKSMLDFMQGVPEQFNYYRFVHDYPQILPYLDQAINCILESWLRTHAAVQS